MDEPDISYEEMSEKEGEELTSKDKIKQLREQLAVCQKERQEYLEGWQRAKADFVNARKGHEKEKEDLVKYANENLISDILDVIDTFEMAFAHKESWEKVDKNWRIGVESIYQKLLTHLSSYGLSPIDTPPGISFNPTEHQPVETALTDDPDKDDTIVHVIQKGYRLGTKVVRPVKVQVAHYESKS